MPRKKSWSYSAGPYGFRVRVYEDPHSGIMYGETRDLSLRSGIRTISLRHRDRQRAMRWATEQSAKLQAGDDTLRDPTPTLDRLFGLYLANQTPLKVESERLADGRRAELFLRFLGVKKDVRNISLHEWLRFIRDRQSGAIDSYGNPVPEEKRRPVSIGTVASDLIFLRAVIHWAMKWRTETGQYLIREDPTRGFEIPTEKNPRRPVVTTDRYQRVLAVAVTMLMRIGWNGKLEYVRSHLADILVLAWHTGRRISAILALRFEDLRLAEGPHGSIRWPADFDKMGRESLVPIAAEVREVLDRILMERPGIGKAWLFPAPRNAAKHLSKDVASTWLVKAEELAGVEKQDGSLFHAYRRGWATARKHLPGVDVAAAGGWADTTTLQECYQRADAETMFKVVSQPNEIRSIQ